MQTANTMKKWKEDEYTELRVFSNEFKHLFIGKIQQTLSVS